MYFDYEQILPSFGPYYANEEAYFRWKERFGSQGVICLRDDFFFFSQPGSHMLLINGLMDKQQSGVK